VTQREGNRNLSGSRPKRFGFFDLAIELAGSQEGYSINRFKFLPSRQKVRCNMLFWRRNSNFCFKLPCVTTKLILPDDIVSRHRIDSNLKRFEAGGLR